MAAAWLFLPWWVFLVIAVYCYFFPFFRPRSLAAPFLIFLFLGLVIPPGLLQVIYAAGAFALILGIKDLVIVNRKAAYEILVFLLSFAGALLLFNRFSAWSVSASFLALAGGILLWLWLVFIAPQRQERSSVLPALAALVLFEIGAAIFLLPLSFFSQAALFFFGSALLFEVATDPASLTSNQFFAWGGAYVAMSLLIVFLASWKV